MNCVRTSPSSKLPNSQEIALCRSLATKSLILTDLLTNRYLDRFQKNCTAHNKKSFSTVNAEEYAFVNLFYQKDHFFEIERQTFLYLL